MDAILGVTTPVRTVDGQVGSSFAVNLRPRDMDSTAVEVSEDEYVLAHFLMYDVDAKLRHEVYYCQDSHNMAANPGVSVTTYVALNDTVNGVLTCGWLMVLTDRSGGPEDSGRNAAWHHTGHGEARGAPARIQRPWRPPGALSLACGIIGEVLGALHLLKHVSCSALITSPAIYYRRDHRQRIRLCC